MTKDHIEKNLRLLNKETEKLEELTENFSKSINKLAENQYDFPKIREVQIYALEVYLIGENLRKLSETYYNNLIEIIISNRK